MNQFQASLVIPLENELGEGPMWHPDLRELFWVDILKGRVFCYHPGTGSPDVFETGTYVSAVVPGRADRLVIALKNEIVEWDKSTGSKRKLCEIEAGLTENRCNDGKCDGQGRLWIGTMQVNARPQKGTLYRLDNDLSLSSALSGLTIANGLGWSPDHRTMYFIDSADRCVRSYSFDPDKGTLSNEQVCVATPGEALPDGMCVDKEGMLWIAFWGGGRVGRYNPETGEHVADIHVPAPQVTSCTFGGTDYRTLYITTARESLSRPQLEKYPLSGSLFACRLPVQGLRTNRFRTIMGSD